jgi:hypothetical protein
MPVVLKSSEIYQQSRAVAGQFMESKWKPNALKNRYLNEAALKEAIEHLKMRSAEELRNIGVGRVLVLVAMGESLEGQIELLKKYRDRIDIAVCDKGFGPLLDHGVKADYVVLCDTNIPFKYIGPWIHQTKDVALIATVYANPEWTEVWKGPRYFFINRDSIESEHAFRGVWPNTRMIPAGSNVGNAMMCFFIGADHESAQNFAGYERYLLVGYDYSWRPDGNYYAWMNPVPKRNYMNHRTLLGNGKPVFTSENLYFAAKWALSYITAFNLPVVNCTNGGVLDVNKAELQAQLEGINADPAFREMVRQQLDVAQKAHETAAGARALLDNTRRGILCP